MDINVMNENNLTLRKKITHGILKDRICVNILYFEMLKHIRHYRIVLGNILLSDTFKTEDDAISFIACMYTDDGFDIPYLKGFDFKGITPRIIEFNPKKQDRYYNTFAIR